MYLDVGGVQVKTLIQTPHLEMFEIVIHEAGYGPGLHIHRTMTEMFYLISGNVTFTIGDSTFTASALEFYTAPPNTPHQWKSCGSVRMLLLFSPSQNQAEYFTHLAKLHEQNIPWAEAIAALADKFDNYPILDTTV